jgi:hypothetical protein
MHRGPLERSGPLTASGLDELSRQVGDAARRFLLSPAARVAAVMAWRRVLQARVVQLRDRAGVGTAWRQPSRRPRQSPPAVTVTVERFSGSAALHRPLRPPQPVQLGHQRPGTVFQILQVAVTVERPAVNTARPAAPVAGLWGARTGVVGLRPAAASAALVEPRAGHDGDRPGPARRPAPHEASPPLAWLPGSDQPTKQAGMAQPEPHRGSTVLPAARGCRHGLVRPVAGMQRPTPPTPWRSPSLVLCCAARVGLAASTKQVVDSPLGRFRYRVALNGPARMTFVAMPG